MESKIINIENPVPILKQERSEIITNPFIPNEQKSKELEILDKDANKIIEDAYNKSKVNSISNLRLRDILTNISSSYIGIMEDIFNKPLDKDWLSYIQEIIIKDNRYTYIGITFILLAIYVSMLS